MFWNKNISTTEYWFIAIFLLIYVFYFIKIIYLSLKLKITARATFLKFIPRVITFGLLIIALLEPSFGNSDEATKTKLSGRLIYFLVDVSKSMDATDVAPSRLEKSKNEIKKIINYFVSDKFGLIAFASEPILISPITSDKENLKTMIGLLNTKITPESGTNLFDAIKMGIEKLSQNQNNVGTSSALVIFTDGEDFSDINENLLNEFRKKRIKLIIVGVGTNKGILLTENDGKLLKNKNNTEIKTKLEQDYLNSLVAKSNGLYFEYNNELNPISEIIENIKILKGTKLSQFTNSANPGNKYHYPLIIAAILICLDLLFTIRIFKF
jgi:Ca-activated chloride channel homolog